MIASNLDILMFAALVGGILFGYPVIFTLTGVAILFALLGAALGEFEPSLLGALSQRLFGVLTNDVLIAIPLFVFMGVVLERSRIAEELLEEMGRLFGALRGGLAVSVVVVGALLAASTGIVGATVVTMALIALPSMLRRGYDRTLAAGTVCTAGTLGQIVPPSTMLIVLSEVMSTSFQQAQFRMGKFTVETISIGQIFAAALVPGLILVGLYITYIMLRAQIRPGDAPTIPRGAGEEVSWSRVFKVLIPPVVLIVAVLGSILGGVATPTEAASVGAVGALLLAGVRSNDNGSRLPILVAAACLSIIAILAGVTEIRPQRSDIGVAEHALAGLAIALTLGACWGVAIGLKRAAASGILKPVVTGCMSISAMIFGTIIGASVFALVFRGLGGDARVEQVLATMPGGPQGALLFVMMVIFVLGFFLDFIEISVIILPVVGPTLMVMGLDPIWLSVLIAMNLQTSFLTPPFGFSLFYMRGATPAEITTGQIYAGVAPYIVIQILGMALVWLAPTAATFLPRALY